MRTRTLLSGVSNASRPTFAVVMAVSFSWVGMGMLIRCYWLSGRVGIPRLKSPFRAKPLADFSDFCFASVECRKAIVPLLIGVAYISRLEPSLGAIDA